MYFLQLLSKQTKSICIDNLLYISYLEDKITEWIKTEESTYEEPDYTNVLTLHWTKNQEYVQLTFTIVRYGVVKNLIDALMRIEFTNEGLHIKEKRYKFKYQTDEREITDIMIRMLRIMTFHDVIPNTFIEQIHTLSDECGLS